MQLRSFFAKSGLLNKGLRTPNKLELLPAVIQAGENTDETETGAGIRAITRDFDGNMLEVVYRDGNGGHGAMHRGGGRRVREIETASSEREARRVLEWQKQVARSINEGSVISGGGRNEVSYGPPLVPGVRRSESYPVQGSERPLRLVRRETITTEHYRRPDERGIEGGRDGGRGGISGRAVIESPERPVAAPRRASYGGHSQGVYTHIQIPGRERVVERLPPRSYVSTRDEGPRPRYVEYVDASPRVPDVSIARIDDKSYVSQRVGRSGQTSRARSRSEVGPRYERPLTILPAQSVRARSPGSHASRRSSYQTAESRGKRSPSRSRNTGSHVSSRSYHSVSTAKASPPPPLVTTTKIRVVPSERERRMMHSGFEREVDRRSSVVERARQVPLPVSVVGGMEYAESVAPSDSVSSVGTKRERERLRSRMSIRDGVPRGW